MSDDVLDDMSWLRRHSDRLSDELLSESDGVEREHLNAQRTCKRCGEPALGYATINNDRYCHGDERSCYTEQHREDTWNANGWTHASSRWNEAGIETWLERHE